MIFDQEPRGPQRRVPFVRRQQDDEFRRAATAMTPTAMWFEREYYPTRRRRWGPPVEPEFPYRTPSTIVTPTVFWLETPLPTIRRRARVVPWFLSDTWVPQGPAPIPPIPPPVPPVITQTVYATISSPYQPAFAPSFAFLGPSSLPLFVGDARGAPLAVKANAGVALLVNLAPTMGAGVLIASATVQLTEGSTADGAPSSRLFGAPAIVTAGGRTRQGLRQTLANLVHNGEYVAIVSVRLTDGSAHTYAASFMTE